MTKQNTKQHMIDTQNVAIVCTFTFVLILFAAYVYFVSASVLHVVMRQEVERQMSTLHTDIATLEAKYIQAQHAVSKDIASLQGYVETEEKIFLDRSTVAAVALKERNE